MWEEDSDNNISDNALTLNLQAYGADVSPCSSSDELCIDTGTEEGSPRQRSRKRKRSEEDVEDGDDEDDTEDSEEIDMPEVVHQMEAEIERQLDSKAKKSNLTVANVKNILKDVITNEHVLDLVRHTMKQPEKKICINKVFSYAPKLTRAKTRELLNTFPSMAWPMTPSKNINNSRCKVLIEQELPEDSSDEEYHPDDDKQKQDSSFCVDQDDDDDDDDQDDEDEQAETDEADAQGDEEEEDDAQGDEEEEDDDEDEVEDEQDSDKNNGNKQSNVKSNNKSPGEEDDEDLDDDDCRLVICDNDNNDIKETVTSNNLPGKNVDLCKNNRSKKTIINNTGTQTSWLEVNGNKTQNQLENVTDSHCEKTSIILEENICQRTRSKLSLSDTPLETIESAFIPPDITTDMYDSECDDEDWKNFLKGFTEPLKPDTQDAPDDDENDPEYNIMADEEDADDKEELREDRGVKVSRKEVNALMAELFEYIGMLSNEENEGTNNFLRNNESTFCEPFEQRNNEEELKDIAEHIAGALEQHTKESVHVPTPQINERASTPIEMYPSPEPESNKNETTLGDQEPPSPAIDSTSIEEVKSWEMPHDQILLLEQQMRIYVQFLTQHFLLTYLHPLYHVYSMDCKQNLLVLQHHAKNNKSSTYYAANLDDALGLVERWEQFLSSENSRKRYMDFMDKEIEMQNIMKRRKQFHRGQFPPGFFEIACNSSVFIFPSLLPTNPFRCDGHTTTPFCKSEDFLIALGLEHFMNYAKNNPKVLGKVTVPKIVPKIVEHFLPARRTSSVYTRILECTNLEGNPIKHFFQKKCVPKTIHFVYPHSGIPPCQQPLAALPEAWRKYIISKSHSNICRKVL